MPRPQDVLVYAIVLAAAWCVVWLWRRDVFRPGSLERLALAGRMRNPARISAAAWLGASLATFLAAAVGAGLAGTAFGFRGGAQGDDPERTAVVNVGAYGLATVVGFLCAALLVRGAGGPGGPGGAENLGGRKDEVGLGARVGDVWRGLGGLVVVLPLCITAGVIASLVAKLLQQTPPRIGHTGLQEMIAHRYTWHAWVSGLMAIVGAPVVEELVYRVFLQSAIISGLARLRMARRGPGLGAGAAEMGEGRAMPGDVMWGIGLSTIAFVLPHAAALSGPASWHTLPSLAVLGVGLGVVYERTRSMLAAIVMHAGFNAVNITMALMTS